MIDKERIAEIREDGAVDGLRDSLQVCLRRSILQIDQVLRGEYIDADKFRSAMHGARIGIEDAETIAAELRRFDHAVVDSL